MHRLRPGDIDIIGALGDSLSAGVGLSAKNIREVYFENRGIAPTSGTYKYDKYMSQNQFTCTFYCFIYCLMR